MSAQGYVDAHVHLWTPDRRAYPRAAGAADCDPASFTPEDFLSTARPSGVGRAVLVQMTFYGTGNSYMLDAIRRHPGVFAGVALVDTAAPEAQIVKLAAAGVLGVRLLPEIHASTWRDLPGMRRLWELAVDTGLLICPLVNPDALPHVGAMCARYPKARVIVDHLGRIGMDGQIRARDVDALCALAAYPNTYVKISAFYALGARRPPYTDLVPLVARVCDAFGPRRLLWGSDCPFQLLDGHTYAGSLAFIKEALDFLPPADREWPLRLTAESLFFTTSA